MVLNVLKKFGTFEQQVAKSEIEHAKTVAGYALVSWKSWKSWKWRMNSDESADQSGKWRTRIGCKSSKNTWLITCLPNRLNLIDFEFQNSFFEQFAKLGFGRFDDRVLD